MNKFLGQGLKIMPIKNNREKKKHMTLKLCLNNIIYLNNITYLKTTMPELGIIKGKKLSLGKQMHHWSLLCKKFKCCKDKCRTCNRGP